MRFGICFLGIYASVAFGENLDNYYLGKYIDWKTYDTLSQKVHEVWAATTGGEKELTTLNQAIEPEAIHALLDLLQSPDTQYIYGTYTPVIKPTGKEDQFAPSLDGLMGMRLVRQLEKKNGKKTGLISHISTHLYNPKTGKLVARSGPDVMRTRMEITPFIKGDEKKPTEGFAGFSWVVETDEAGNITKVRSESYLDDQAPSKGLHGKMKFPDVSFCGMSHHCNVCHHRTVRSIFRPQDFEKPLEKNRGVVKFLKLLSEDSKLALKKEELEKLRAQLLKPKETFAADSEALRKALIARWKEINAH